jgi:hypothetical protein
MQPKPAPEAAPSVEASPAEKWDLKSVAEKLRTDPAKLYEQLTVAVGDGEEITVSAMKDLYRPAKELETARAAFTEEMSSSKAELLQATREFQNLLSLMDQRSLTPAAMQEAARLSEQQRAQEAEKLLKVLPGWKDPITKAAEWSELKPTARKYGFTDAEIKLAELGYADHRMLALVRALSKAERAAEAPKPAPKVAAEPKSAKAQTEAQRFGRVKAAVTSGRLSRVAAVEQILKGE